MGQATVAVDGHAIGGLGVRLHAGWNLFGPTDELPYPTDLPATGPIWWWDAAGQTYRRLRAADALEPGKAYWIYVRADCLLVDTAP